MHCYSVQFSQWFRGELQQNEPLYFQRFVADDRTLRLPFPFNSLPVSRNFLVRRLTVGTVVVGNARKVIICNENFSFRSKTHIAWTKCNVELSFNTPNKPWPYATFWLSRSTVPPPQTFKAAGHLAGDLFYLIRGEDLEPNSKPKTEPLKFSHL